MQEPFLTSFEALTSLEITNPDTALFLADASKVRYIRPYFARESSVSEAAKMLELPLANMRYWVSKMVELGLLACSISPSSSPVAVSWFAKPARKRAA